MPELEDRKGARGFVQGESETLSIAEKEARGCFHHRAAGAADVTDTAAFINQIALDLWTGEPPIISNIDVDDWAILPRGAFYSRVLTGRTVNAGAYLRILDQRNNGVPVTVPPARLILESDGPLSSARVSMIRSEVFPRSWSALVSALKIAFDVTTAGGIEGRTCGVSRPQGAPTPRNGHKFLVGMRGVYWNVHPHDNFSGVMRMNFALMRDVLAPLGIRVPAEIGRLRSLCVGELLSVKELSSIPFGAYQACGIELYARLGRMLGGMKW